MKYIASLSGGKDSAAAIILAHEHNEPLDEIIFSEVMYSEIVSGELPEHIDFVKNVDFPLFESWGYKTRILRAEKTYLDCFNHIVEKPRKNMEHKGKKKGFVMVGHCAVQRDGQQVFCGFLMRKAAHTVNTMPERERSAYGKTKSATERKGLRDLARQGIVYHGGGSSSNAGCRQRKRQSMRHLVIIYTDTTSKEAIADYMEHWRQNSRRERRRQYRRRYFLKQRLTGVALLALTMLAVKMLDGDATIALITVPLGLYLIFTGEMVIAANLTGIRKRGI